MIYEWLKNFIKFDKDDGAGGGGDTDPAKNTQDPPKDGDTFKFKDPANYKEIDLPKSINGINLEELLGHVISKSRQDTEKKYKQLVDAAKEEQTGEFKKLQEKIQQLEDERLSAEDRVKVVAEREKKTWETKMTDLQGKADRNWYLFQENKITNDIYSAFTGFDLYNPEQTMMILRTLGKAKLVEENNNFYTKVSFNFDGQDEEFSPREAVQKFLARPENAHHLKNNLKSGNGTSTNGARKAADGSIVFTRSQLNSDPRAMKEYSEKMRKGEDVRIVSE